MAGLAQTVSLVSFSSTAFQGAAARPTSRTAQSQRRVGGVVGVRAEGGTQQVVLNPGIKKDVDKVVDTVVASELAKPMTAYCRCWRSGTFPLCDGTHAKHNKATGDNVGPLLLKK